MKINQNNLNEQADHAPGAGSDKQHPETPSDANDRFKKQNQDKMKEQSGTKKPG
ncbi:MAG: hypothetical protein ABI597_11950 [Gammaproteobacteria bacterium]